MLREIGISIYPDHSDPKQDQIYLEKAATLGYTRVFMSMLEVSPENQTATLEKFSQIIHFARDLNFEVILDINPQTFTKLGISYQDLSLFKALGASGIRLDEAFSGLQESLLSYNPEGLKIELNMSNDVAYLDNIMTYQPNAPFIYGCHNLYPQKGSGLPYDFFVKASQRFKKYGIKTAAFVTSQTATGGPWTINDGLPTLEIHRDWPIALQAKHLFATNLIDTVIIGNAYATDEELAQLAAVNRYCLTLNVEYEQQTTTLEKEIVEKNLHFRRGDITDLVIRSTQPRVKYAQKANPAHDHTQELQLGDIVIGNDDFKNYKNELQIILKPQQDIRKNLVARIKPEERFLLEYIKPWTKFKLQAQ